MNIEFLKNLLKRDVADLTEVASNIEPGYVLSKMEVQIIQSRINNLANEIDELFLAFEMRKEPNEKAVPIEVKQEDGKGAVTIECKELELETITPETIAKPLKKQDEAITTPSIIEKPPVHEVVRPKEKPQFVKQEIIKPKELAVESTKPDIRMPEKVNPISADSIKKKTLADNFPDSAVSLNEIVGQAGINSDRASMLSRKPIVDIHKAINLNERIAFIRDLFNGDVKKYTGTIDQLNALDDFSQAIDYINREFNWDQSSDNFKTFIEIVYRRYIN